MRNFVIAVTSAAGLLSTAALAQEASRGIASEPSQGTAPIPNVTGNWVYPFCCGFTSPLSGPGPVVNKARMPQLTDADGRRFPPGANVPLVSSVEQLVGDYSNPILKPQAAEAVKKDGESELTGIPTATPRSQCWPEGVPFFLGNMGMQMIQQPDKIIILYDHDRQVRHVRMNQPHSVRAGSTLRTNSCVWIVCARSRSQTSSARRARLPMRPRPEAIRGALEASLRSKMAFRLPIH